jgi:hypothetical protein
VARFTTIVAVIGPDAGSLVSAVAHDATNVGAVRLRDVDPENDRDALHSAWREAQRRKAIYTLIDFDPMERVVAEWCARLTGADHRLDVEVGLTGAEKLPDYLLVIDEVEGAAVQWYHGLLRGFAPRRVVTVGATPGSVHDALIRLRPERSLPDAHVVAEAALVYVPTGLSVDSVDRGTDVATPAAPNGLDRRR